MKASLKITHIFWTFFIVLFATIGCETSRHKPVSILKFKSLENISAGSGICQTAEGLWVVGDDSPFLYLINDNGDILDKFRLSRIPSYGQENYAKSIKPDFEAIDVFNDTLLIIGSGSQNITRDTAFVFDSRNKKILIKKSIHNLYQKFYLKGDFPIGNSINIEGLANDKTYFYFLHRGNICGNNRIYRVNKKEMINYLFDHLSTLPDFTSYIFELPMINGSRSGFSGAYYSLNENALFVTISVEETSDVYNDGDILGSFIAKFTLNNHLPKMLSLWPIKDSTDQFIETKLESLYAVEDSQSEIRFYSLSDNDNEKSGFYQFLLH